MARPPVLLDTTRLFTRLKHASPTGIDRVDLAYARHFLAGPEGGQAVAVTRFGTRLLPSERLADLLATIDRRWNERVAAADDPVLAAVLRRIDGGPRPPAPSGTRLRIDARALMADVGAAATQLAALAWPDVATAPRGALYLHTSHLRLDRPQLFAWLDRRPDIRPVFFVHDLIPIEFPEYGVPGEAERHATRMETVARRAAAVVVNSQDVGRRFTAHCAARGLPRPPVTVAPLGVEPVFTQTPRAPRPGRPYFVVCSTIEARKNHLLLLQVWREIAAALGDRTPTLVIVGRRGWESESAVDLLDRAEAMRDHVVETSSLSTAGLATLVAGARALLMPSFAEGYGIPVVEALSVGTPVVASDIPVFREIAGSVATLLHPLDGPAWRDAVTALAAAEPGTVRHRAPTWADHFRIVDALVETLA